MARGTRTGSIGKWLKSTSNVSKIRHSSSNSNSSSNNVNICLLSRRNFKISSTSKNLPRLMVPQSLSSIHPTHPIKLTTTFSSRDKAGLSLSRAGRHR